MEDDNALPISALSHLVYCERRAALVHVVGAWADNAHTAAGQIAHRRIDAGDETSRPGLRVLRSVHVRSELMNLSGIIDLLEVHGDGDERRFVPVETKRGPRRRWERDEIQLCAQAMALEEMTDVVVREGAIFHTASQRRRSVRFSPELREATTRAAARLHELFKARCVPAPVADERCPQCSLRAVCQPNMVLPSGSLALRLRSAFE